MDNYDIVIIGGGASGMSAAISAKENGTNSILILEKENELGGILEQCIHNGFGVQVFKEELSGPEFAERLFNQICELDIEYKLNTTVLAITSDKRVRYVNPIEGVKYIQAKAIILSTGCSERNRGAISIPGKRVKGVYTAGTAQKYLNMENILVGKKVFILGSGDIGLIMARRMTLEGAKVLGVAELMPYSNGLMRNIVQCLEDFNIPLYLSHTVTNIEGKEHVERITIQEVDSNFKPISGTEKYFECDTLLLSVGLIPDNLLAFKCGIELDSRTKGCKVNERLETSIDGIYACGNALHVHDLVDFVTLESKEAGKFASEDIINGRIDKTYIEVEAENVQYTVPQHISRNCNEDVVISFRVKRPYKNCIIEFLDGDRIINQVKKRYLLPAEMERIKLNKMYLNNINSLKVRVIEC